MYGVCREDWRRDCLRIVRGKLEHFYILDAAGGSELARLLRRFNAANMRWQGCTDRYMVSSGRCARAAATAHAGGVSARLLTALMSGAMNAHLLLLRKALSIINYCCGIQIYMYNGN